jgi:predicted  nucleic acid-binding Zn-ribbon protein
MEETMSLRQRLEQRLSALRQELDTGRKMLADLEARQLGLQQTVLRISGAVQALEELLAADEPSAGNGSTPAATPTAPTTDARLEVRADRGAVAGV